MSPERALAVAARVLRQIRRDRRFLGLVGVAPLLLTFFVRTLFDATTVPPPLQARFVVPFGAYIVHFATFILTAIVLVRERTSGTLERMFVNGYRQGDIVTGYLAGYTTLATGISVVELAGLQAFFDLGYSVAQTAAAFAVLWALGVISLAMGILVSNLARTEGQVIPFIPLVIIPSFLFSGIVVAVDLLPTWAQVVSRVSPMYYANRILQEIVAGAEVGSDLGAVWPLPLYGAVVLAAAALTLRERA